MAIRKTFLLLLMLISLRLFSQDYRPTSQTNPNLDFTSYLSGVKYAYIAVPETVAKTISLNPSDAYSYAISGIVEFLKKLGFSDVKWGTTDNIPNRLSSLCDLVLVFPSWSVEKSTIKNIKFSFVSCNKDVFEFVSESNVWITGYTNFKTLFYNKLIKMYGYERSYSINERLKLPSEITSWNELSLKNHFQLNGSGSIEGIYESATSTASMPKYKIGIIKTENAYKLIYLSGASNFEDWKEGEIKGTLIGTATSNLFKTSWKMADKKENNNAYFTYENGLMNLFLQGKDKTVFIKLFPITSENIQTNIGIQSSGTGFGISSNGLIATNSHVLNNSNRISVRGINGDFTKSYKAKIIMNDKNNDIAIIQIDDNSFTSLGEIPYSIDNKSSEVGISVFALGYPLKALMGDEIKLTNGIISSKSGYQGDITSYQITVPLQPGNSGGPLFDYNGNLIGIVNSKLLIGENVSYAVKVSYLKTLLDDLPIKMELQNQNQLKNNSLSDQVKVIKNFVFIIDIN